MKFRKVYTFRPLQCLEMDINMAWLPIVSKNAYLLFIIDVYTRRILKNYFSFYYYIKSRYSGTISGEIQT
jgi:putative transposase